MSRPILLAPHHDDETLFAAFTCCRVKPLIAVVLRSTLQEGRGEGTTDAERRWETGKAAAELGCPVEFWHYMDHAPDWHAIEKHIGRLKPDHVYAPAVEMGGHPHHNTLGEIADVTFAWSKVTHYTTYVNGGDRTTIGPRERVVPEPWMVGAKLRALACYESQIRLWPHHFLGAQHEYYAL